MTPPERHPTGPLAGIRVVDMTRVLAGPSATQILGDLGADVVKVERPGAGDDTRAWGPPFLKDAAGNDTTESAYYLSANRNKRSLTVDFTTESGQYLLRRLIGRADIFMENFRTGTLVRYGLSHADLAPENPRLITCSITGFGHTGPYAAKAGYDLIVQAMGGIMSITGTPDGEPVKAGVAIADLMAGMYATVAVLAALRHRDATGEGQAIDLAMLDTQLAWLSNAGQYFLTSGEPPARYGNAHPTIAPYESFRTADGHVILGIGNDAQFRKFCEAAGRPDLAADPRFFPNAARVRNRKALLREIAGIMSGRTRQAWLDLLEPLGVPCGPINSIAEAFSDPQAEARGAVVEMEHHLSPDPVRLIASPLRFSATPVDYRRPPPVCGEHTAEVLREWLGLDDAAIAALRAGGVV